MNKKVQDALNNQVNAEFGSAYIYLAMSSWFQSINLAGFAHWMRIQALEELVHADKFFSYINERRGRAILEKIDRPQVEWTTPLEVFEAAFAHEQHITALINDLVGLSMETKDFATLNFLQWFVAEQVEEEASADGVVQKLKLVEKAPGGLFLLDQELSTRVFTPPPAPGGAAQP